MGSGSSKPKQLPQHLAPKAAFKDYSRAGYKFQVIPKSMCVALGDPSLADRHPDKLALLMLYDTRYAWYDISLEDYRKKLRNVFKGDGQVLRWVQSDQCRIRLDQGREYLRRRQGSSAVVTPFSGDPMYGCFVDCMQVCRNLQNLWVKKGIKLEALDITSWQGPTNPDAPEYHMKWKSEAEMYQKLRNVR